MPWSCLHESLWRGGHGDEQHLGSEATRAAVVLDAPQAHQHLQGPATAKPCTELRKQFDIALP